jgi:hypothetical protein
MCTLNVYLVLIYYYKHSYICHFGPSFYITESKNVSLGSKFQFDMFAGKLGTKTLPNNCTRIPLLNDGKYMHYGSHFMYINCWSLLYLQEGGITRLCTLKLHGPNCTAISRNLHGCDMAVYGCDTAVHSHDTGTQCTRTSHGSARSLITVHAHARYIHK